MATSMMGWMRLWVAQKYHSLRPLLRLVVEVLEGQSDLVGADGFEMAAGEGERLEL